jgi:hypothetical protein
VKISFALVSTLIIAMSLVLGCQTTNTKTVVERNNQEKEISIPLFDVTSATLSQSLGSFKKGWDYHLNLNYSFELKRLIEKKNKNPKAPGLVESFYKLGKQALMSRNGTIALDSLKLCLAMSPNNLECHWELGWSQFLERDYQAAVAQFEWVRKFQPKRTGINSLIKKVKLQNEYKLQARQYRRQSPKTFVSERRPSTATVKVHAVGDTMLGTSQPANSLPPEDLSILELIGSHLAGSDIMFANYEGTICEGGVSEKCSSESDGGACFAFASPPSYINYLQAAGVSLVSIANNHIMDFGEPCREQTEKILEEAKINWSGRLGTVARMSHNDLPISMIAFHSADHSNSTLDYGEAVRMVVEEKKAGRLVIISFHGGAEGLSALHVPKPAASEIFYGENRGNVVEFSRKMVDAGADLVLGSGPHVVRGMEFYKERLIAYSLGNFATYKMFNLWGFNGIGLILEVELHADGRFMAGKIIPTKQIQFGVPVYDESQTAIDLIRMLSRQDFPESGVYIARDGSLAANTRKLAAEEENED